MLAVGCWCLVMVVVLGDVGGVVFGSFGGARVRVCAGVGGADDVGGGDSVGVGCMFVRDARNGGAADSIGIFAVVI